jgi:hypothetical protein
VRLPTRAYTPELLSDALLVVSGPYSVIVPRPEAPADFYDRLSLDLAENPAFAFEGAFHDWPRGLVCSLDTGAAAESARPLVTVRVAAAQPSCPARTRRTWRVPLGGSGLSYAMAK